MTTTIKIPVELRPAHILGKRNSTVAEYGVHRVTANTKAGALALLECDVLATLRFKPTYRGGKVTRRIYALTCEGGNATTYSWCIAILNPANGTYPGSGALCFAAPSESEALNRLDEYVASCEQAATPVGVST